MSENVKIQIRENGSVRVTGTVDFVDSEGNVIKSATNFSLFRCGHSAEKPFCDGSHRAHNFQAPAFTPAE